MRKLALLTSTLLVVVLALISGFSTARPAWAICYCDPYEPYTQTDWFWGKGSTCADAQTNLASYTRNAAYTACGSTRTCLGDVILVSGCYWVYESGWYQVTGYQEYKCKVCEPIERDPIVP